MRGDVRDGREHKLEDAERDGRDACAPHGWFLQHALQAEVFCGASIVSNRTDPVSIPSKCKYCASIANGP